MSMLSGPPQQASETSSPAAIELVSIAFGWLLGLVMLTVPHAWTQTLKAWRRVGRVTAYAIMVWINTFVCVLFGILCWLCAHGTIHESFIFFFIGTTLRCIIIQLTVQILTDRIAILVPSPGTKRLLKWGPFTIEFILNIGVYCVWIPAHLSLAQPWVTINDIYSRFEKSIYTILDLSLNLYFCHLVKSKLVNAGIRKYKSLYRFNMTILGLGVCLDLLLIGLMSLSNPLVYVQFYPVIFMGKLNIEMFMADEIAKIAQRRDVEGSARGEAGVGERIDQGSPDSGAASASSRTNSSRRGLNSSTLPSGEMQHVETFDTPQFGDVRKSRRHHDCLYHAWISGGTDTDGHLTPELPLEIQQEGIGSDIVEIGQPERRSSHGKQRGGSKSGNDNGITKHVSVLVRAESAESSVMLEHSRRD